jgi:hypothetical protein
VSHSCFIRSPFLTCRRDEAYLNNTLAQLGWLFLYDCPDTWLAGKEGFRHVQCSASGDIGYFTLPMRRLAHTYKSDAVGLTLTSTFPQPVAEYSCYTTFLFLGEPVLQLNATYLDETYLDFGQDHSELNHQIPLSLALPLNGTESIVLSGESVGRYTWHGVDSIENLTRPSPYSIILTQFAWVYLDAYQAYRVSTTGCTVAAHWVNVSLAYEGRTTRTSSTFVWEPKGLAKITSILIDPAWARRLENLYLSLGTGNQLATMGLILLITFGLSSMGTMNMVDQISWVPSDYPGNHYSPVQRQEVQNMLTERTSGVWAIDRIMTASNWTDFESLYIQKVSSFISGYGYDSLGSSVRLSIAVLATYSAIAAAHLIYKLATGRTSVAWETVGEVLMLGLNSKRPEFLGRTSGGVDSMQTYRQNVNVGASAADGSLELLFDDDPDVDRSGYRNVEINTAY